MSGVLFYNGCRIKTGVLTEISVTEAEEKDINFYDYDGFRLLSYTNAEALAMTELPSNPIANENLTFDGWNWTLSAIKNQINNVGGVVNVGAVYHTTDGKTHITCNPTETFPNAAIRLSPSISNDVVIDWGDGTTDTWTTTSNETKSHTYTGVTDSSVYDITISCSSGTYNFNTYIAGSQSYNQSCVYTDIKLSNKVTRFGPSCFVACSSLRYITIPNTVTSFGSNCFYTCYSLRYITIPDTVTSFGSNCFYDCPSLQSIIIPDTVTSLSNACFAACCSLRSITIPYTVTSFGDSCFQNCYSLQSITIPDTITSFGSNCFYNCYSLQSIIIPNGVTSLGNACFQVCCSLQSITIPNGVTSLGSQCFQYCNSLKKIYMQPSTPPTLANTNAIPSNAYLVIYVPRGTLSTYQNAEKWSTYSSKMVEYNF